MNDRVNDKYAGASQAQGGGTDTTVGDGKKWRWPTAFRNAILQRWNALTLERQFLLTAALAVGLSMAALGYWVESRIRSGWIQGMAETGALYLEGFLAPHVQGLDASNTLPEESREKIQALLVNTSLGRHVAIIKLWDLNGNLIFSTSKVESHGKLPAGDIKRIMAGNVVVDTDLDDDGDELRALKLKPKLIEIYAPIYREKTRDIIAIGEFYEFSQFMNREISSVRYATWFLIANVAIVIVILLHVIVKRASRIISSQQALLEQNLARAEALAKRNNALRRAADRARLNATVLNETYLASIGADIHDGPIQLLSLMMLKLPSAADRASGTVAPAAHAHGELEPLIQQVLSDLRNLSSGLALPEAENLSLAETIHLAITRHEQQTGTHVLRNIAELPAQVPVAIRFCSYRVVQEALTNAYKHAGGRGQKVEARIGDDMLEICVSDSGSTLPVQHRDTTLGGGGLGVRGMDSRIKALRGQLTVSRLPTGGTEVRATLPMRS